jgi:GNAT superfamily N-acetyltransferase
MSRVVGRIETRPYADGDEGQVIQLLNRSLGPGPAGERPSGFFRWKHVQNPFGRSLMLIAEADGRVVGLRAFMRWRFVAGDTVFRAVRAVDTATDPEYQGRGIFTRLTLEALDALRGEADFVFNTPNGKSLPGYLKMGWSLVGQVPVRVKVRRPVRFVRNARGWKSAAEVGRAAPGPVAPTASIRLTDDDIQALQAEGAGSDPRFHTPIGHAYLRWRYADAPLLGYRATEERRRGELRGLAIFRVRPRGELTECTVAETIARDGDVASATRALRRAAVSAPVDHVVGSFPSGSVAGRAALRAGFVRVPGGLTLAVNTLGHHLEPDPRDLPSWGTSAGDLEVF